MRAADGGGAGETIDPEALLARFAGEDIIALAVSGGADSLALMLIAADWRRARADRPRVLVLSVDHGLRPEAASEVAMVGGVAERLGLAFHGLRADAPSPSADIEAAARMLRYRLLAAAAREAGARILLTAHHADDQAETLLLRLARGSGVYGLGAMAPETPASESALGVEEGDLRIARPLLGLRRADLAAYVRRAGLVPVEDPHNSDDRFARARLRALMPQLAAEGLDVPRLTATAARLRRTAAAIDDYVDRLFDRSAVVDALGAVRIEAAAFAGEPEETRLRALARLIRAVGGSAYSPRIDSLAPLDVVLRDEAPFRRTLGGVLVDRRKGFLRFQRETGRTGVPVIALPPGRFEAVYDGRFHVSAELPSEGYRLAALGENGRRSLAACLPDALPRAIAAAPALFRGEELVAAPLHGRMSATAGLSIAITSIVVRRLGGRSREGEA